MFWGVAIVIYFAVIELSDNLASWLCLPVCCLIIKILFRLCGKMASNDSTFSTEEFLHILVSY